MKVVVLRQKLGISASLPTHVMWHLGSSLYCEAVAVKPFGCFQFRTCVDSLPIFLPNQFFIPSLPLQSSEHSLKFFNRQSAFYLIQKQLIMALPMVEKWPNIKYFFTRKVRMVGVICHFCWNMSCTFDFVFMTLSPDFLVSNQNDQVVSNLRSPSILRPESLHCLAFSYFL